MAMDAIFRIPYEAGIWDIPCKCDRPELSFVKLEGIWMPLKVELIDLTAEQELYLIELSETYNSTKIIGRNNFALRHKKDIEIRMIEEVWNLQSCYITDFNNNSATIKFDKASTRFLNYFFILHS